MKLYFLFIIAIFLNGCSGYRVKDSSNPLRTYQVSSLAIPMFVNKTVFPNVNSYFTKEIYSIFSNFSDLKLYSAISKKSEALLVGIISTKRTLNESVSVVSEKVTSDDIKESLGDRRQFNYPRILNYQLSLQLILIRNPSLFDIKLAKGKWSKYMTSNSKVLFNEEISLSQNLILSIYDNLEKNAAGSVNYTQNKYMEAHLLKALSIQAAEIFKQRILYAF